MNLLATNYNEMFLDVSRKWLNDPEIRHFMNTRYVSKPGQRIWFETISNKKDYNIWGITSENIPIGVFGIKNIRGEEGEFWGYIGEKQYWGLGIGDWMVCAAENKANELGLTSIRLRVLRDNYKAVNLYFKHCFKIIGLQKGKYVMKKDLHVADGEVPKESSGSYRTKPGRRIRAKGLQQRSSAND